MVQPALLPTAYLPPVGYFQVLLSHEEIWLEQMETYRKQSIRNHCRIFSPNGIQKLTIPVERPSGNHTMTRDVRISFHEPWQRLHWRSIETAYNNSPFFLFYRDHFSPFYQKPYTYLVDFNLALLNKVLEITRQKVLMKYTAIFQKLPETMTDFRQTDFSGELKDFPPPRHYTQTFEPSVGFLPHLSVLDLLCNLGPETVSYIRGNS
jgi:hypothetical protein